METLAAGDYRLTLDPERGGSVAAFEWRGEPLFRATCGPSILDTACFPLVPFSNRIACGRFTWGGRDVVLPPNFPGGDHPHPLHGFGWQAAWEVVETGPARAVIAHRHAGGAWPWRYRAEQALSLDAEGLTINLFVTNEGTATMPAGLGFHPYFPRDAGTVYRGLHHGEWTAAADGLPLALDERDEAVDWWHGAPVASRIVDTVYCGRAGPLEIAWPRRGIAITIHPSPMLDHTVVYAPAGRPFFCVEPVGHMTDALNRAPAQLLALPPGARATAGMRLSARTT